MNMYGETWAPPPVGMSDTVVANMNDAVAQLTYMRRAVGELEVGKAMLEREVHNTVAARNALTAELCSMQSLCSQLEKESDVKTREKAELQAEVDLLNNMMQGQLRCSTEETQKLRNEVEEAVHLNGVLSTELETMKIGRRTLSEVQKISADALTELHETQDRCKSLEAALTIQKKTSRELDNALQMQKDLTEKARREFEEERHHLHRISTAHEETLHGLQKEKQELQNSIQSVQHDVHGLQKERQETLDEKDAIASALLKLWDGVTTQLQFRTLAEGLPSMTEIIKCSDALSVALKHEECNRQQQRLQYEVDKARHEQMLAGEKSALIQSSQQSLMSSTDAELKAAKEAAEECRTQMKAALLEAEGARAETNQLHAGEDALKEQLSRTNGQVEAMQLGMERMRRDQQASAEEAQTRLRVLDAELQLERSRTEKLTRECEMAMRQRDEMSAAAQAKKLQFSEQLNSAETKIIQLQTETDAALHERKACSSERDVMKMELKSTSDQLEQHKNAAAKLRVQLKHLEVDRANDIAAKNEVHTLRMENEKLLSAKIDIEKKFQTLELEHVRTQQALIDSQSAESNAEANSEKEARMQLSAAPVGSTVMVSDHASPALSGRMGIVIAHAMSPTGEPGALVGFQAPLGEELILLANLRVISAATKPANIVCA
eukprot:TRINITY_DN7071_c0_g1_i4.p1 TRINITY_DN7071_c0_g1~~TRINITY_DN7071_c0_g1_i4.p1  ORF type:complete len:666 (+),score=173.07 TRINITY_DN7071_c0_g1_i4:1212-3209(+)